MAIEQNVLVLIGGVGGAKLARGLAQVLPAKRLTFVVNTGDDFWHLGLRICPDLDTVMYTLAGLVNTETGWGLRDDSAIALNSLRDMYQVEPWFRLGDKDLATHLLRSELLRRGLSLTEAAGRLARALGVESTLLPMCDEEMPTMIDTVEHGELSFQDYFVKRRWQPTVKSIRYADSQRAKLSSEVRDALAAAAVVLLAPSNPWLSIAPILSVPGMRASLTALSVPVVAITPIIGGAAVKGPTAKIMRELGWDIAVSTIVRQYAGIINGFVNDIQNESLDCHGPRSAQLNTLMRDDNDKRELARATLAWIESWGR